MKTQDKNDSKKKMGGKGKGWLISKRILSSILCFVLVATLTPSVSFAASNDTSSSSSSTGGIDASTYASLGINQSSATTSATQPYGKATKGELAAMNVRSELFVKFNGSIHYGWSVLDDLDMTTDGQKGSLGYWKEGQTRQSITGLDTTNGALYGDKTHDVMGDNITNNNKHWAQQYNLAEAFSPNTGKDNYVAQITVNQDSKVTLNIYNANENDNGKVSGNSSVASATVLEKDTNTGEKTKTNIYNWEYDALYDLAAGDIDNDGYDEIAVYASNAMYLYSYKKNSSGKYELKSMLDGGKRSINQPTKMSSDYATYNETNGSYTSKAQYAELGCTTVALEFGDINCDDKEELIAVESMPYGSKNISNSRVYIYSFNANEKKLELGDNGAEDHAFSLTPPTGTYTRTTAETNETRAKTQEVARAANVAVGDVDGDNRDELIIAGYCSGVTETSSCENNDEIYYLIVEGSYDEKTGSEYSQKGKWQYYTFDDESDEKIQNYTFYAPFNFQEGLLMPPVAMACVNTKGVGNADQVYIGGHLFEVSDGSLDYVTSSFVSTSNYYDNSIFTTSVQQQWIVNVIAGNFDGNAFGKEQLIYTIGTRGSSGNYWFSIGYINKKDPNSTNSDYYSGAEVVMSDETSYNNYSDRARSSLYLSLAAVDSDDDSTLLSYKSQSISWTNPEVLAVLQSAPYFQSVEDNIEGDYVNQAQTAYGTSKGDGSTITASTSISAGIYASFEQDISVFGVKIASFEAEVSKTHTFDYSYEYETEYETEITYSGKAGNDYAVVYAVPYIDYQYDIWVPGYTIPGKSTEYEAWIKTYVKNAYEGYDKLTEAEQNEVIADVKSFLKPGDETEGSWQPYTLSIPLEPSTAVITVDGYDKIAEASGGRLEKIRGNILNNTPGEPSTYDIPGTHGEDFQKIGEAYTVSSAEGANITASYTIKETDIHSFNYTYSYEAKAGAGVGGVTVGATAGFGLGVGGGMNDSTGVTYSATVDNLPTVASEYSFTWQFGYRKAKLNKNDVVVLEYQISNVMAPPDPPGNVQVDSVTSNEVTLSWDAVPGAYVYKVYQVDINGELLQMGSVPATTDGRVTYTERELTSGSTYKYTIKTAQADNEKSLASSVLNVTTLDESNGEFKIVKQPDDQETYIGGSATFTVDAEYKNTDGTYNNLKYKWEKYDSASQKWVGCNQAYTDTSYTVSGAVTAMSGTKYRCRVYSSANLYLYSREVTLTIGKAKSETTLSASKGDTPLYSGDVVTPSYIKTETKDLTDESGDTIYNQVQATEVIGGMTYNKYSYTKSVAEDGTETKGYVYEKDGKYYTKGDDNKMAELEVPTSFTVEITTETETSASTSTSKDNNTLAGKTTTYDMSDFAEDTGYDREKSPMKDEVKTSEGGVAETYTADKKYKYPKNGDNWQLYICKDSSGKINHAFTKALLNVQSVVCTEYQYITVDSKKIKLYELTQEMTNGSALTEIVSTNVTGDTITLTANVAAANEKNQVEPIGSVTFTVVSDSGVANFTKTVKCTNAVATCTWTPTAAGVYTITASYGGDTTTRLYSGSSSASMTINAVVPNEKRLSLTGSSLTYGGNELLTASFYSGSGNPAQVKPTIEKIKCDGVELDSGGISKVAVVQENGILFTPSKAGAYKFTITYKSDDDTLTAEKSINVYKRSLIIKAKNITETTGNVPDLTGTDKYEIEGSIVASDKDAIESAIQLSCTAKADSTNGEYPIKVTYAPTLDLVAKYSVSLVEGVCELTSTAYSLTDNTTRTNGTVTFQYTYNNDRYIAKSGDKIPKGAKLVAIATPEKGYKVAGWKVNNSYKMENSTKVTSNTITIDGDVDQAYTVEVEFELEYYTLNFNIDNGGSIGAKYINSNGTEGNTFTSSYKLSPLEKVQITANPANGYAITGWSISKDNGASEQIKASDGTSAYTGKTYTVSNIDADTVITVSTAKKTSSSISVQIIGADGTQLASDEAYVSFNNERATASSKTFTYTGNQHDNVTVEVTLPEGLIVDSWEDGSGNIVTKSLSANKKTLTISDLGDAVSYKVNCKTPNSYKLEFSTTLSGTDNSDCGEVKVYKNGADTSLASGSTVTQASELRIVATPKDGYQFMSLTINGVEKEVTPVEDDSERAEYTISSVSEPVTIVADFVKKPVITYDVDGGNGNISATYKTETFTSGSLVSYGSKDAIVFTADPADGYEVDTWTCTPASGATAGTQTLSGNYNNETCTYTPDATKGFDGDLTVKVKFKKSPVITFTAGAEGVDANGTITATQDGKSISTGTSVHTGTKDTLVFTATPANDKYEVEGWTVTSGGKVVYNSENSSQKTVCTLTPDETDGIMSDVTVDVTFKLKPVLTFTAGAEGAANGEISAVMGSKTLTNPQSIFSGTKDSITFTATPDTGYEVDTWTVAGEKVTGTSNNDDNNQTYTLTLDQATGFNKDTKVNVTFKEIPKFDITYKVNDKDVANADAGLDGKITLSASRKGYTDSIVSGGATGTDSSATIYEKSVVTVTLAPDEGYRLQFLKIDGDDVTKDVLNNEYEITESLGKKYSVEAQFEEIANRIDYEVDANGNNGKISAKFKETESSEGVAFDSGTSPNTGQVVFTATPDPGYKVEYWTVDTEQQKDGDGELLTLNTFTYNVNSLNSGAKVKVKFVKLQFNATFTIEPSDGTGGTVRCNSTNVANEGIVGVKNGQKLSFTATPAKGYMIGSVTIGGAECTAAARSLTAKTIQTDAIKADTAISVTFAEIPTYTVTLVVDGEGSITKGGETEENSIDVKYGDTITLTAVPNDKYHYFVGWVKDGTTVSTDKSYSVSPTESVTLTAKFAEVIKYKVSFSSENVADGSVKLTINDSEYSADPPAMVAYGSKVVFEAIPAAGKCVKEWIVTCGETVEKVLTNLRKTLTIENLPAGVTVQATFMDEEFYTVAVPSGVTVAYEPSKNDNGTPKAYRYGAATVTVGKNLNLSLSSSKLKTLIGDNAKYDVSTNADGATVIKLTDILANIDITSAFSEKSQAIAGGGGGIAIGVVVQKPTIVTPQNGTVTLSEDGTKATITPNDGYQIASVKLNNTEKGAVTQLTGLKTGDTVEVTFERTKGKVDSDIEAAVASIGKMKARSSRTKNGNVKVVLKDSENQLAALTAALGDGYTVKYRFYRSTKKSSNYKAKLTKKTKTYINTDGKKGTRYYYKVQIRVYDAQGKLVAKSALKNCKYACRKF